MFRIPILIAALVALAFAGCLGDDGDDGGPGDDDGPGPGDDGGDGSDDDNATVNLTASRLNVTVDSFPPNATMGEAIEIAWSVDTGASAQGNVSQENNTTTANATAGPEERPLNETGLAWGFQSVADPMDATDYEQSLAAHHDVEAPGNWSANITVEQNATNDTGNETGNETGNGSTNLTLYLRAYAVDGNGTVNWSEEVEIAVEPIEPVVVEIGGLPGGPLAGYDPEEVTIPVGGSMVWENNDALGSDHTATYREGPAEFDTGVIAEGEASEPIVFTEPGTYTYACDIHPTMSEATIIVTDGNETA